MQWHTLYPPTQQPTDTDIADYIGTSKHLYLSLTSYIQTTYKAKPKLTYSSCGMKPGWNIKYQKSGQSFGTLYPEDGFFSVFLVVSYKLAPAMEAALPHLSDEIAELYRQAGDYMKLGRWMMFEIKDSIRLEDYKKIIAVKLPPS